MQKQAELYRGKKWACKELGLVATDTLRLPMTPITDHGREIVTAALKHAGLL